MFNFEQENELWVCFSSHWTKYLTQLAHHFPRAAWRTLVQSSLQLALVKVVHQLSKIPISSKFSTLCYASCSEINSLWLNTALPPFVELNTIFEWDFIFSISYSKKVGNFAKWSEIFFEPLGFKKGSYLKILNNSKWINFLYWTCKVKMVWKNIFNLMTPIKRGLGPYLGTYNSESWTFTLNSLFLILNPKRAGN